MSVGLKKWFAGKGRLQLFAIFLALFSWVLVHSGQTVKQRLRFPIEYTNLPSNLIFSSDPPSSLRLTLTGAFHRVRGIDVKQTPYLVDLSYARFGKQFVEVDLGNLPLPVDVEASNPNLRRINFELSELKKKDVPVEIVFIGEPAEGFSVAKVEVTPNPIQLTGPAQDIDGINVLKLDVDISERSESFSTSLLVELDAEQTRSVDSVFVEIQLDKLNVEKIFEDVSVKAMGWQGTGQVKFSPPKARLILRSTETDIEAVGEDLQVDVSVEGLAPGRYRLRGTPNINEGVQIVEMDPESFIVEITE